MLKMVVCGGVTMDEGQILVIVTRGVVHVFHGKCRRPVGHGCVRGSQGWVMREIILVSHISLLTEMFILLVLSDAA